MCLCVWHVRVMPSVLAIIMYLQYSWWGTYTLFTTTVAVMVCGLECLPGGFILIQLSSAFHCGIHSNSHKRYRHSIVVFDPNVLRGRAPSKNNSLFISVRQHIQKVAVHVIQYVSYNHGWLGKLWFGDFNVLDCNFCQLKLHTLPSTNCRPFTFPANCPWPFLTSLSRASPLSASRCVLWRDKVFR